MRALNAINALLQTDLLGGVAARLRPDSQQPLGYTQKSNIGPAPTTVSHFSKKQQDNKTCPTYGESQWTGTVTVDEGSDLFYWYFDSRNDPEHDPIIIWLSGGPGGSSMTGLFTELGPCFLEAGTNEPEPNPWSWNNNASVLFIDQPAGTGLSSLDGSLPVREQDTAIDFQQFLNIFFTDVFPDKHHLPIHLGAESYGGHYGPVYLHHILQSRRYNSKEAFWGNITSLILVNGAIDFTGTFVGVYKLLCEEREKVGLLNATACESIARSLPEQQRLGSICRLTYDAEECRVAYNHGVKFIHAAYIDQMKAGHGHPGNIYKKCGNNLTYPQCTDPYMGNISTYLNQEWIKKALDKPPSFYFEWINRTIFEAFEDSGAFYLPTTRQLVNVLEAYADDDKVADIRVLVINGNLDFTVNTPGNIWQYDRLMWSGQAEYSTNKWQPLPNGLGSTGTWKATNDGRLAFMALNEAGHTVPGDAREGSYRIVLEWLRGGWRM